MQRVRDLGEHLQICFQGASAQLRTEPGKSRRPNARLAATALGGASVPINGELTNAPAIGFDWFLIDLFMMAMIFVPVERFWPQDPEQGTFREEWTLDVAYFLSTHLPIQILSLAILLPAPQASRFLANPGLQKIVGGLP